MFVGGLPEDFTLLREDSGKFVFSSLNVSLHVLCVDCGSLCSLCDVLLCCYLNCCPSSTVKLLLIIIGALTMVMY